MVDSGKDLLLMFNEGMNGRGLVMSSVLPIVCGNMSVMQQHLTRKLIYTFKSSRIPTKIPR
jgi:hypothetical protein